MRRHAGVGGKILEHLDRKINVYDIGYFRMASRIAYEHHERYDGSGYPNGLSGEDISLEAQITAIVDVFDALMSHRPYKPAFSADKSFSIIEDSKGTHFSPTLVEYFLEIKDTLAGLHAKYTDSI